MCRVTAKDRNRRAARTTPGPGGVAAEAAALVAESGRRLLATSDPLTAELLAAAVLALPYRDQVGPELHDLFVHALCRAAGERPSPESAALLRAVAAVASPSQRRLVAAALGEVTGAGHYPPEWAAQIGRATAEQAWRRYDVFGDTETVAVTFGYGAAPHAMVVQIDRCQQPTAIHVAVVPDVDRVRAALDPGDDPLLRLEPIGLPEARARLAPALARDPGSEYDSDYEAGFADLDGASLVCLPVARARVRRLPPPDPAGVDPAGPRRYGAADRAAAVAEFLASPHAAAAGEEKTARFWAEVFAGYSASVPGEAPSRVGPLKLPHLLLSYVPNTFALSPAQRQGLPAAVTAWTEWAGQHQQLAEPARAALRERVPEVLASFDAAYDDPDNSRHRSYLADLSAATTDAGVLAEALSRRALAVRPPGRRDVDQPARSLDPADPAGRRALVEHEFGECEPPEGMSRDEFLAAAVRVSEQLWHDDPPQLWRQAREMVDAGMADHDIMHRLAAAAAPESG
jgi:hypothetical protein